VLINCIVHYTLYICESLLYDKSTPYKSTFRLLYVIEVVYTRALC